MRGPVPSATGPRPRREIDVDALLAGVLEDHRPVLARAITLLESTNPAHREKAQQLLLGALPHAGGALRIGITGVPGVGKSTFIESFGLYLVEQGLKVAVLAVDPSSEADPLPDREADDALAEDGPGSIDPLLRGTSTP